MSALNSSYPKEWALTRKVGSLTFRAIAEGLWVIEPYSSPALLTWDDLDELRRITIDEALGLIETSRAPQAGGTTTSQQAQHVRPDAKASPSDAGKAEGGRQPEKPPHPKVIGYKVSSHPNIRRAK